MLTNYMNKFFKEENGQGLVEYVLLIALLVIVVLGVLSNVGSSTQERFQEIDDALSD